MFSVLREASVKMSNSHGLPIIFFIEPEYYSLFEIIFHCERNVKRMKYYHSYGF